MRYQIMAVDKMSDVEGKLCEMCSASATGAVNEYFINGNIKTHYACISHLLIMVNKYSPTFKNNKW